MEDEATEDMEMMAAILPSDKPYFRSGRLRAGQAPHALAAAFDAFRHLHRADYHPTLNMNWPPMRAHRVYPPMLMGTRRQLRLPGIRCH